MSTWRRKALEQFPSLRREISDPQTTIYGVFFEIGGFYFSQALDEGDDATLRKVFAYAAWCLAQPAQDVSNAAAVAFYEHIFDGRRWDERQRLWPFLQTAVVYEVASVWEWCLPADRMEEIRRRFPRAFPVKKEPVAKKRRRRRGSRRK
jgi:hypothetical protein